ncbi:MAG: FlgD immunoglobulin-like domain containing protein, partial [candidate division WOR-3 bacterium]
SIDTSFTIQIYTLPDSLTYRVATTAYDTGIMSIRFVMPNQESIVRVVTFDTIPILSTTRTEISFNRNDTSFPMEIDWDGNGTPDTVVNPNFNDTMGLGEPQVKLEEKQLKTYLSLTFYLGENIPNPFKSQTTIFYSIPKESNVLLQIYDISGKLVKNLVNKKKKAGVYKVKWNGRDENGKKVPCGTYFYQLKADKFKVIKKMIKID